MPHLQRRTTLVLALFIGFAQLAAAFAFYLYQMAALSSASSPSPGTIVPDASMTSYGLTWAGVYQCAVLAGILLSVFAARGAKLWCAAFLVVLVPAVPWALLLLANHQLGA